LNVAFFDRKVFLSETTQKERESMSLFPIRIPAYVHAQAIKIYVNALNEVRRTLNEEGQIDLGKYDKLVLRLAEKMDLGLSIGSKEINIAQECYSAITRQIKELPRKE